MPVKQKAVKKIVEVELCDLKTKFTGRLLGLVNDSEFYRIVSSRRTQNKLFSSETKPLKDITDNYDALDGMRIAIAVRTIDGEPAPPKRLFITERLEMVAKVEKDQVGILAQDDQYVIVTESDEV